MRPRIGRMILRQSPCVLSKPQSKQAQEMDFTKYIMGVEAATEEVLEARSEAAAAVGSVAMAIVEEAASEVIVVVVVVPGAEGVTEQLIKGCCGAIKGNDDTNSKGIAKASVYTR